MKDSEVCWRSLENRQHHLDKGTCQTGQKKIAKIFKTELDCEAISQHLEFLWKTVGKLQSYEASAVQCKFLRWIELESGENLLESEKDLSIEWKSTFLKDPKHTIRSTRDWIRSKHVYVLKRPRPKSNCLWLDLNIYFIWFFRDPRLNSNEYELFYIE